MDDHDDREPFPGKIMNRDGKLKIYSKARGQVPSGQASSGQAPSGYWKEVSNFSLRMKHHSANKVPGEGRFFIFEATMDDEDGATFLVPFTLAQLDSNQAAYAVLAAAKKPFGGVIFTEKIGRCSGGSLNGFLMSCVKKYQRSGDKAPALVLKKTGFIDVEIEGRKIQAYTIGPNVVLPTSAGDVDAIKQMKKVWIGDKTVQDYDLPMDFNCNAQSFLDEVQRYHGPNRSSPIAAICYSWLTMHKQALAANGLKIGILQVVGDVSVGKSTLRAQLEEILPKIRTDGGNVTKIEDTISFFKLHKKITESRWVFIQDPPPPVKEAKEVERLNSFGDCYYENKCAVTSASKHNTGDKPDCGVIFVWPHEFASLHNVNRTYLTKGVFLVHTRNDADFEKLEQAWRKEMDLAPAIFLTFLQPPDMKKLVSIASKLRTNYHKALREKDFDEEILNESSRVIDQYTLLHAAAHLWKNMTGYDFDVDAVGDFFLEICIPYVMNVIQEKKSAGKGKSGVSSPEKYLTSKISNLSDRDFLANIAILHENHESHFGFSHIFHSESKVVEKYLQTMSSTHGVKAVLHKDSDLNWFKRTAIKGYDGHYYGKSNRLNVFVCPVSKIPEAIKQAIKTRLDGIFPCVRDDDITENLRSKIDSAFDDLYHPQKNKERISHKAQLMNTIDKHITEEDAKLIQKYTNNLLKKRKRDSNKQHSSDESHDDDRIESGDDAPSNEDSDCDKDVGNTNPNMVTDEKKDDGEGSVNTGVQSKKRPDGASSNPIPSTSAGLAVSPASAREVSTSGNGSGRTLRSHGKKKQKNN